MSLLPQQALQYGKCLPSTQDGGRHWKRHQLDWVTWQTAGGSRRLQRRGARLVHADLDLTPACRPATGCCLAAAWDSLSVKHKAQVAASAGTLWPSFLSNSALQGVVKLKNMATGNEEEIQRDELVSTVVQRLKSRQEQQLDAAGQ